MEIILFRGRPGTGKTTLSDALAKEFKLPLLRKDDIYDVVADAIAETGMRNKICYDILYSILGSNINNGSIFILDYPFQTPRDHGLLKTWCNEHGFKLTSIVVNCSNEEIWAARFNHRAFDPKPSQLITNFEDLKKHYQTMQIVPGEGELEIDTVKPIAENIKEIVEFLGVL